jgi:hypothetical protein
VVEKVTIWSDAPDVTSIASVAVLHNCNCDETMLFVSDFLPSTITLVDDGDVVTATFILRDTRSTYCGNKNGFTNCGVPRSDWLLANSYGIDTELIDGTPTTDSDGVSTTINFKAESSNTAHDAGTETYSLYVNYGNSLYMTLLLDIEITILSC